MAYSLEERQRFGIHGLLPPTFMTQEQQAERFIRHLRKLPKGLARYIALDDILVSFELARIAF